MALLAKHGWRLMQSLDSLVGRILKKKKKKNYSNGTFLNVGLGSKPSYLWRSVWNARKLLQEGLIWRVGDGKSIKVWEDK
jgi:hypothetical protein